MDIGEIINVILDHSDYMWALAGAVIMLIGSFTQFRAFALYTGFTCIGVAGLVFFGLIHQGAVLYQFLCAGLMIGVFAASHE